MLKMAAVPHGTSNKQKHEYNPTHLNNFVLFLLQHDTSIVHSVVQ